MNTENDIKFAAANNLGIIILNRPSALNALSYEMIIAMQKQLLIWIDDPQIKAVMVQSNSEKAFSAGGDIRKISEARAHPESDVIQFFWHEYRLNYLIATYPKPYIALMNGITMGGGVGISVHGSFRVAGENFSFAMPETGIGFFPDVGGSYFLPRCPGQTGIYLGLTGARIKAADAFYLKLIDYVVPSQKFSEITDALTMADFKNDSKHIVEQILKKYSVDVSSPPLAAHRADIDDCFKFNTMEEIFAALDKKNNEWCHATLIILQTKSPTSLKVTLEQLRRGAKLTLAECLQMEYQMVTHFLQGHDFYEGVRAVIVDKDQKPQWQPVEVNVSQYFASNASNSGLLSFQ